MMLGQGHQEEDEEEEEASDEEEFLVQDEDGDFVYHIHMGKNKIEKKKEQSKESILIAFDNMLFL